MKRKVALRAFAWVLCLSLLHSAAVPASAAGEGNESSPAFANGDMLTDVLNLAAQNSEELTGLKSAEYADNSTLEYVSSLVNRMAPTSAYRLALEGLYGDALTVENAISTSTSLWEAVGNDAASNPSDFELRQDGNTKQYLNQKSMTNVLKLMKLTTTPEQYAALKSADSPQKLFDLYAAFSEANGTGGEYFWTDTDSSGMNQVRVGDTVLFTISAESGGKSVEGSWTQKIYKGTGEKIFDAAASYTISSGSSVSYSYIGTVVDVNGSGARATLGNLDLSGLGVFGGSAGGDGVSARTDKYGNIYYEMPGTEPSWGITVRCAFVHNLIDIRKMVADSLALICDKDGNVLLDKKGKPLTVTGVLSQENFVASTKNLGYYSNDNEAKLAFRRAVCDYIIAYEENILGYPPAFSVALCAVMNHETGGSLWPGQEQNKGPAQGLCQWEKSRLTDGQAWCYNNGYDFYAFEGQLQLLNHEFMDNADFNTILMDCMASHPNDYVWCVQQLVSNYEKPLSIPSEIREILEGEDGNGVKYYKGLSDKADNWFYLKETYLPQFTGASNVGAGGGTPVTSGPSTTTVNAGETMQDLSVRMFPGVVGQNGWLIGDKIGQYKVYEALFNLNNRYAEEHPESGVTVMGRKDLYPDPKTGQKIYVPTVDELYAELGYAPE